MTIRGVQETKPETLNTLRAVAVEPTYFNLCREELDVADVVSRIAGIGANCIRLGALSHNGRAYYPSDVMPRAPGLRRRDIVAEFAAECEKRGIVLGIYSNSMYVEQSLATDAWSTRIAGEPLTIREKRRRLVSQCHLSPYFDKWLDATREIVARYRPAFYYIDCFQLMPGCACPFCRRKLRRDLGLATVPKSGSRNLQAYYRWIERNNLACAKRAFDAVRETHPQTLVVWNRGQFWGQAGQFPEDSRAFSTTLGQGYHVEAAVRLYGESFFHIDEQTMIADAVGTPVFTWVEYPRMPWSHLASPPAETRIKAAKVFANGSCPMMWSFPAAPLGDQRGLAGVARVYKLAAEHADLFDNTSPVADTAVLFSTSTSRWYARADKTATNSAAAAVDYSREFSGTLEAFLLSHVPAKVVLEDDDLSDVRALFLPNTACLSDQLCKKVRRFVRAGGGLVATYETSLYDENARRRTDFALADVFGASFEKHGPQCSFTETGGGGGWIAAYVQLTETSDLVGDLPVGFRFPVGGKTLHVRPKGGATVIARLTEPTRYYCDFPGKLTRHPGVVVRKCGKGTCVYLPWQVGRACEDHGLADVQRLVSAAARFVRRKPPLLETDLPDTVTVTLRRAKSGDVLIHLVNLSTDPAREVRAVAPAAGAAITLRLPRVAKARALVAAKTLKTRRAGRALRISLPAIGPHEVVHLT